MDELALIWDAGCRTFPPRLPDQPIFYPVISAQYAAQIARDWNTKSRSFAGYVTSFDVDSDYLAKFNRHVVGSAIHEEYWIPAEQLPEFNRAIQGVIKIEDAFFGDGFEGFIPEECGFKGKNAEQQLLVLARVLDHSRMDFELEVSVNRKAVFLNCPFWSRRDFSAFGVSADLKTATLVGVIETWEHRKIDPGLPNVFLRTFSG